MYMESETSKFSLSLFFWGVHFKRGEKTKPMIHNTFHKYFMIFLYLSWSGKSKKLSPFFVPHVSSSFSGGVTCHFHFAGAIGTG